VPTLDLHADAAALTRDLCDIPSVSGEEGPLADAVEDALRRETHLEVLRDGNAVVARTRLGRAQRVVLAGHLDTVPVADNLPVRVDTDQGTLHGRGTVDMKGGVAVALRLAATITDPARDVTVVLYDCEEVEASRNGLGRLVRNHPDWVDGDVAVLLEPTAASLEGGCNGTLRVDLTVPGRAAHSARAWMGVNAVHATAPVLDRLAAYPAREVEVDGLVYREGLNAVGISGGIAGNVIPDRCTVSINYRFAPDRSPEDALGHLHEVFGEYSLVVTDLAPGARPGLDHPVVADLVAAAGGEVGPKLGWTDVARFTALGIPAVNYGPGDPALAHHDDEHVPVAQIVRCESVLAAWLTTANLDARERAEPRS
jgi:succinyl-diaminopimelate desuccinylase